jgi:predicted RNA-binding Zn-ribbon protein involved in translation (DUF1610 family)
MGKWFRRGGELFRRFNRALGRWGAGAPVRCPQNPDLPTVFLVLRGADGCTDARPYPGPKAARWRPGPLKPRAITDRTCQPSAHNCGMSAITQTTVVFSCPKCGLNYQATQEHSSEQSSGSFDCKNCETNVLKWSGVYDYSRWTPVTLVSDGKARGGAARRPQPIKP